MPPDGNLATDPPAQKITKYLVLLSSLAIALALLVILAFLFNPWPSAILLRSYMDKGGEATAQALEKDAPKVSGQRNLAYRADRPETLDVFYPSDAEGTDRALPTVVWIHGGGWLSGNKNHLAGYLKRLAAKGFTTVGVDYPLAPANIYPAPLQAINAALDYLQTNAAQLHVDPNKIFIAGDSVGAQIAAQLAAMISDPEYARSVGITPSLSRRQLLGSLLFCGFYDGLELNYGWTTLPRLVGPALRTQLWSYIGTIRFQADPRLRQLSVLHHVTPEFPPSFISVGNADWLEPQSHQFADRLKSLGVSTDTLFFPKDNQKPLYHEYQFNLQNEAANLALERSIQFLVKRLKRAESAT